MTKRELHVFSDASTQTIAAMAYTRIYGGEHNFQAPFPASVPTPALVPVEPFPLSLLVSIPGPGPVSDPDPIPVPMASALVPDPVPVPTASVSVPDPVEPVPVSLPGPDSDPVSVPVPIASVPVNLFLFVFLILWNLFQFLFQVQSGYGQVIGPQSKQSIKSKGVSVWGLPVAPTRDSG
ncbi:uncharacterized protein [Erythrolamprus reginae]|uniref:uncharacterized protein n=1 Tax=Erythrolamprus reginae TaxID=121349 RepID=UPI00396CC228